MGCCTTFVTHVKYAPFTYVHVCNIRGTVPFRVVVINNVLIIKHM